MRQRHIFLLTLLQDDAEPERLRGRVQHVATAAAIAFTGTEQLIQFLLAPHDPPRLAPPDPAASEANPA